MQKLIYRVLTNSIGFYINLLSYTAPEKAVRLAYKYFSEPQEGKLLQDKLPKILQEAQADIITHNDMLFQVYRWQGAGKKVLLVHGWESNASRWEEIIPYLQNQNYDITALDAPAHGLTEGTEFNIPLYAAFIDLLVQNIKPQFMIGHSLGGATALFYQSHYKSTHLQKMVILGAPSDLNILLLNYKNLLGLNGNVMKLFNQFFVDRFDIKPDEFSAELFVKEITIPGLIVHDTEDSIVAFSEGVKIANSWKNSELITTTGLGHSLHDNALYKKIIAFLEG